MRGQAGCGEAVMEQEGNADKGKVRQCEAVKDGLGIVRLRASERGKAVLVKAVAVRTGG